MCLPWVLTMLHIIHQSRSVLVCILIPCMIPFILYSLFGVFGELPNYWLMPHHFLSFIQGQNIQVSELPQDGIRELPNGRAINFLSPFQSGTEKYLQ